MIPFSNFQTSLNILCNKVIEAEDERDDLVQLVGQLAITVEHILDNDLSVSEEVEVRGKIDSSFEKVLDILNKQHMEKTNAKIDSLTNPFIDSLEWDDSAI